MNQEMQTLLKGLASELAPMIEKAAKDAVAAAGGPVVSVVADPVIDAIDAYVMSLLGTVAPANAVAAPTDVASRLTSIEKHVAALTVATVGGASHLAALKNTATAAPNVVKEAPPAAAPDEAPTAQELLPTPAKVANAAS